MSLSSYLWGIRLFTFITLLAWLGVVFLLDPRETGVIGMIIFFVSLFVFLSGFFFLFVVWFYRKGLGDAETTHHLSGAFRQAVLLSLYTVGIIFFQYAHILVWWDALLFFATILLIEFSFRHFSNPKDE